MSTTHNTITSISDSDFKLEFNTSLNGCYFMMTKEGTDQVRKVWFNREQWDELVQSVNAYGDYGFGRECGRGEYDRAKDRQ